MGSALPILRSSKSEVGSRSEGSGAEELIKLSGIAKQYEGEGVVTPVLHGINLTITSGEFVAIMGPSGSGKSTLLHILGFLDRQSAGSYHFNGQTMEERTDDELADVRNREIGFVFQAFNLLPRETVLENVLLPLRYSGVPEREHETRAREAITAVGLSHRMMHPANKLSGGEKQRAAIARALVTNPKLLLADEPTGNLDSVSGEAIVKLFTSLHRERGHTIILITHEEDIAHVAERIIYVRDGKIAKDTRTV